ncbi:hypothetical protein B566_EDAN015663 [Ephemera danica]|nr:hypothetical protein B566_EDAN015663 [Ephemera danica]
MSEFSNGTKKQLVSLIGTIPVRYKGNVYNIPICIWLMDTHPYNAPICYVQPTADMQIKVSKYVDHNGKIYLPYLHDWEPNSYNLLGVVQVMIMVFGEQPPVYAKPKDPPANPASPYPVQPPSMPMPGGRPNSTGYPPYPLYPGAANPPYPSMPASGNFPPSSYPPNSAGSSYPPYYPNQSSGGTGYPPYPTGTAQPPPSGNFPPYAATGYPPASSATATGSATTGGSGTITEEHIRASLLSAVEDKLRRRMREQYSQVGML